MLQIEYIFQKQTNVYHMNSTYLWNNAEKRKTLSVDFLLTLTVYCIYIYFIVFISNKHCHKALIKLTFTYTLNMTFLSAILLHKQNLPVVFLKNNKNTFKVKINFLSTFFSLFPFFSKRYHMIELTRYFLFYLSNKFFAVFCNIIFWRFPYYFYFEPTFVFLFLVIKKCLSHWHTLTHTHTA